MKTQMQKETCTYGERLLLNLLQAFQIEISGALEAKDSEHIHQLRVTSRRLRSTFPLFKSCLPPKASRRWSKQINKITGSLGEARDLDVQIALLQTFIQNLTEKKFEPGVRRIILRLTQQREMEQEDVICALDKLNQSNVLSEMTETLVLHARPEEEVISFQVGLYRLSYKSISKQLKKFLSYDEYVHKPECIRELHKMRIAAKRLRYTIEIFAPIYQTSLKTPYQIIRKTQEMLGVIHDCDVWIAYIPEFMQEEKQRAIEFYGQAGPYNFLNPGLLQFLHDRQAERDRVYEKFRTEWERWKADRVWEDLLDNIQMPTFPKDAIPSEELKQQFADHNNAHCSDC